MSTRGAIARRGGDGWRDGRYHHWDSYPSGLGKSLWDLYRGHFHRDLSAMLKTLLDDHPAGWSVINGKDFSQKPGFVEREDQANPSTRPRCYCHGDRHEEANPVNQDDDAGMEWAYVFDEPANKMHVLMRTRDDGAAKGRRAIGMFGTLGGGKTHWRNNATVELAGQEPDWSVITCGEELQFCIHYRCLHGAPGCARDCHYCKGTGVASAKNRKGFHQVSGAANEAA